MNLVPEGLRGPAADRLVAAIETADWHLTTGFVGVGYILPVLCSHGHADVAYRLIEQDTAPSWRYMIDAGATTIWERWDGWIADRGFQSAWMNSFNHYALGSVGEWLYRFLLGIDQVPGTAGFGQLLVRPHPGGSLGLGPRPLPVGPRAGRQRLATGRRPVHVPARAAAERHRQRPDPQPRPRPRSATAPAPRPRP